MPAPMQLPPGTPSEQAAALDAASFFALFFDTLRNNPPHANDGPMLDRMRRIGLDDRRPFNFGRLSPQVQQALADAQPLAGRRIADGVTRLGTPLNGWNTVLSGIGTYGTDYTRRASIAYAGLGAPTPEDVLYPVTVADSKGRTLNSDEDYVLHFEKGQLPPANAFWSLHVYNSQHGFAANPANRYVLQHRRPEVQRRRFAGRVHPAPRPRRAQARELAERAGLRWPVPVEHAPVLAAGPGAGRLVGAAAGAPRLKHVPRRDARRDSMRRALFLWSPGLARGSDGGWKRGDGRRCGAISVGTNPRSRLLPDAFRVPIFVLGAEAKDCLGQLTTGRKFICSPKRIKLYSAGLTLAG